MSWKTFESNMENLMSNHVYGQDMDGWAKQFTTAYDSAIKMGGDLANKISVLKGNTAGMESILKLRLKSVQPSTSTTLLDVIGPAVVMYWTGALMSLTPPPKVPAPGAVKNTMTIQGLVTNPGSWTPNPVKPNTDSKIFIKAFISSAKLHLTTVSGQFIVTAVYPPNVPGPGIVPWVGYKV